MSVHLLNDPWPINYPATGGNREWDANHDLSIEPIFGLPHPPLPPLPGLREFVASIRKLIPSTDLVYPELEAAARNQGIIPIISNADLAWTSRANGGNVSPKHGGEFGIAV